jgi:hypothetical protein
MGMMINNNSLKNSMRILGYIVAGLFGLFVLSLLGMAFGIIGLPFHAVNKGIETSYGIVDKTLTADNAIYNYRWFIQQKEDIKAMDNKMLIAEKAVLSFETNAGARKDWTFEDKTEGARLRAVAQGLRSQNEHCLFN